MLKFRVQQEGKDDYIVRSQSSRLMSRSVNVEINLEPGRYYVYMKITAFRHNGVESTEEAVSRLASNRREKLVQIGLSYDLAHAKGRVVQEFSEKCQREAYNEEWKKRREETVLKLKREWIRERKMARRKRRVADIRAKESQQSVQSQKPPEKSNGLVGIGIQNSNILQDEAEFSYPTPKGVENSNGSTANDNNKHPSPEPSSLLLSVQPPNSNSNRRKRRRRPSIDTQMAVDGISSNDQKYLEGFEFDPDLDMPEDRPQMDKPPRMSTFPSSYSDDFQSSADPWNAVCVVGLRVYSKDRELSLEVARPCPITKRESQIEASLDMDDPAVSATNEFRFFLN